MYADMIRVGHPAPVIEEVPGPYVRTALVGGSVDQAWMQFLASIRPARASRDLNCLLLLRHISQHWWVDEREAAPFLLDAFVTDEAYTDSYSDSYGRTGKRILARVDGIPSGERAAWHVTSDAIAALTRQSSGSALAPTRDSSSEIALRWASHRGRTASTELASIVGAPSSNVGQVLKQLEAAGQLASGRELRRGAGFFYVPTQ